MFWKTGTIAIDYGAKTYPIGYCMEQAEAKQIISKIKAHLTKHGYQWGGASNDHE